MIRTVKLDMPRLRPSTKRWWRITDLNWYSSMFDPQRVRIADLIATQPSVTLRGLLDCDPEMRIYVVQIGDKKYIRDGHHRTTVARLRGKKTIDALVLKLER